MRVPVCMCVCVCIRVCLGEQPGGEINISQWWRKIAREVGEILNKYYDEYKLSYDSLARPTHIHAGWSRKILFNPRWLYAPDAVSCDFPVALLFVFLLSSD